MNGIFAVNTNSFVQFLVALLMLVFVVVLCYFTTRFIANYQKGATAKGNIEVLEAKGLGNNKMLEIVRVGEKYYILGVSKDNVTLIDRVDKEELKYEELQTKTSLNFSNILDNIRGKKTKE